MGGQSTSQQTQQSQTSPWAAAQPALQGILSQLNGMIPQSGINGTQTGALNNIESNASGAYNPAQFAPQIQSYTNSLLNGGGANNQAGNVNQNYLNYQAQTQPLASNTNYNPYSTPGFGDAVNTLTSDITNNVNGSFAAAGRDFSGANSMALGRGLTQGIAPVIQSQYNQNVQNQQGAAGNLYNAGNTNAGILSGLQQQYLANQGAGVQNAGSALDTANAGSNTILQAEAQRLGIPVQQLGLLAQIGIPIAGLGSQSSGSGTTTNQMSGADQFLRIASGIGSLIPKGPISFGGSTGGGG